MNVVNIPLKSIENTVDKAIRIYKRWVHKGSVTAVLARKEEVDRTFQILHSIMGNNFLSMMLSDMAVLQCFSEYNLQVFPNIEQLMQYFSNGNTSYENEFTCKEVYCFLCFIIYENQTAFIAPAVTFIKALPANITPFGYYLYEGDKFFTVIDKKLRGKTLRIYASTSGYGSSILMIPILKHLIRESKKDGFDVEIIYDIHCPQYTIFPYVIKECAHHLYTADIKLTSLSSLLKDENQQAEQISRVINLMLINYTYISKIKQCHVVCEALDMIGLDSSELFYDTLLTKFRLEIPSVSYQLKSRIYTLRSKYKYIVGVQLFTSTDYTSSLNEKRKKTWDLHEAQNFVDLCNQHQIAVVNMSPDQYQLRTNDDISYLAVGEIVSAVGLFDAVVGVDSMGTLAAGIMGIPNITLWQKNLPDKAKTPNGAENNHI